MRNVYINYIKNMFEDELFYFTVKDFAVYFDTSIMKASRIVNSLLKKGFF